MTSGKVPKIDPAKAVFITLTAILMGAIVIMAVSMMTKTIPFSIDLSEYTQMEVSGYDGYGKASCNFDREGFLSALKKLLLERGRGSGKEGLSEPEAEEIAQGILEETEISFSREESLQNGDIVRMEVSLNENAEKILEEYGIQASFQNVSVEKTVEGLPEVISYDPFPDVEVSFDGAEPYGEVHVSYDGKYDYVLYAAAEPKEGLSNGDQVRISVVPGCGEEELRESYGLQLAQTHRTIEVSGLKYYPDSISKIPHECLNQIMESAEEIALSNIGNEYGEDEQIAGLTGLGQCLASSYAEDAQNRNQLYCVFQVDYANTSGGTKNYVYFVRFTDIMVDPVSGSAVFNAEDYLVPRKPGLSDDEWNLDLSEFVLVQFLPPRIVSGFNGVRDIYYRYVSSLEDTCLVTSAGADGGELWQ